MKYKPTTKRMSASDFIQEVNKPCERKALLKYISIFGMVEIVGDKRFHDFISHARRKGWIGWLLDKGFIEEVKEEDEQPFVLGDLLLCPSDGYYYLLTLVDSVGGVCLIRVHSSTVRWTDPIKTINPNNISLEEMKMIFGYSVPWSSWFSSNLSCGKKIKRTIKVVTY